MDAVERIEVTIRSLLATHHALRHGLFAYATDPSALPSLSPGDRSSFLAKLTEEQRRSKDPFVQHFTTKYGDSHAFLPVWMAAEIMSFGTLLTFHRGCHPEVRKAIAQPFGVHDTVFASWLLTLNTVRNICAHHGRLWNREIGTKPKIPDKLHEWSTLTPLNSSRVFVVLTICKWCLDRVAPQSSWTERFQELLAESEVIPLPSMGFPDNWTSSPIWSDATSAGSQGEAND